MMPTHPDEGTLQAYLDGEVASDARAALERHLEGCAECRSRLRALEALGGRTDDALASLPVPPADLSGARQAVRRSHRESRRPERRRRLAAAASVVLLLAAGAVAAMPGSPVRGWVGDLIRSEEPVPVSETSEPGPGEVAVEVPTLDGVIQVSIEGAVPGSMIAVEMVDTQATTVRAPAGSRFASAEGRIDVDVTGVDGTLYVTIPRTATDVVVSADGDVLLRIGEDGIFFPGPAPTRESDTLFRFEPGLDSDQGTEGPATG